MYDDKLELLSTAILDQPAMGVFAISNSSLALVKLINGSFIIINTENLFVLQEFTAASTGMMSFFAVDLEERFFWLNHINYTQNENNPYSQSLYRFKLNY